MNIVEKTTAGFAEENPTFSSMFVCPFVLIF